MLNVLLIIFIYSRCVVVNYCLHWSGIKTLDMKLELKHLAPYLPYELQMYCETMNGCETFKWTLQPNNIDDVLGFQNKPILRPLSDLQKKLRLMGKVLFLLIN